MHVHYPLNFSFILIVLNRLWTSPCYAHEQFPISPLWERSPHPDENINKWPQYTLGDRGPLSLGPNKDKSYESWLSWGFSSTLIDYHQCKPNKEKLSSTVMKNLSTLKVCESAWESMTVHESFRPNESESLNSHQLSSSFGPRFTILHLIYSCIHVT